MKYAQFSESCRGVTDKYAFLNEAGLGIHTHKINNNYHT